MPSEVEISQGRVAVFCGSALGTQPNHTALAVELGHQLAARGMGLVYGGGQVGLMGILADAVLQANGHVIGVIPTKLAQAEIAHPGLTELHEVKTMHERKALMYSLSDGFCALPGGLGTLEEVFEAATWTQLKLHDRPKPVVLLDNDGFWSPLEKFLSQVIEAGFIQTKNSNIIRRTSSIEEALTMLAPA